MKKILAIILLIISINSFSQQDPQLSHYFFLKEFYNPAFSGSNSNININLLSHQQWMKFTGAPFTTVFSADAPFNLFDENFGVGLNIVDDRYGFVRDFRGNISLSYKLDIASGRLSIGVNPGIFTKKFEPQWLFPDQNENILGNINGNTFDLGVGLVYGINNLFVGISSFHFLKPKFVFYNNTGTEAGTIFLENHYYLIAGYTVKVLNSSVDLTPSIFIKSDGSKIQEEINIFALYNKKIWLSVSYRNRDALVFFAGTSYFNNIKLGLSYDLTLSYLNRVSNGTFEAYIGYSFSFLKNEKVQNYKNVKNL